MSVPWVWTDGGWRCRTWWMVALNGILRRVQPWTMRKWVVYSMCTGISVDGDDPQRPPEHVRYGFGRVLHTRRWCLP